MRGESTWFKMFKSRHGIESRDESQDLLPSDQLDTVPTEVGALVSIWKFMWINSPLKVEFISIWGSHFSKKLPLFSFPIRSLRPVLLSKPLLSTCSRHFLCYNRCAKTSNAWSLLSEVESLWALRQGGCLKYSHKFARTGVIVRCGDGFAERLKIKWSC